MVVRKQKKIRKQRGSRVMGYGRISGGHRKSGSRGGVGAAGRKAHHWIKSIKMGLRDEKRGFQRPTDVQRRKQPYDTVNVQTIANIASKSSEKITEIDIREFGYEKVLGKGRIGIPLKVTALAFSEKAESKITKAGGKCITAE